MAMVEPDFAAFPEAAGEGVDADGSLIEAYLRGENVAEVLDESAVASLGSEVLRLFEHDEASMEAWEKGAEEGRNLADLALEERSWPFEGAACVKYPLAVSAGLQFNARAYPAIVSENQPVKVRTYGDDPEGLKAGRAARVGEFMSYQLTSLMGWEEQMDKLLMRLPFEGTVWRKVWYDPVKGPSCRNCTRIVVDNSAQSMAQLPRIGEELFLQPHEVVERIRSGRFWEFAFDPDAATREGDEDHTAFVEMHIRDDLDEDGYPEPLIVTLHKATRQVVRIEANFRHDDISLGQDGQVTSIKPREYYIPYAFWPDPRGGFLGIGLGHVLTAISENINSILQQLIDAGSYSLLGGGFLASGVNLGKQAASNPLAPGEWRTVGVPPEVLRGGIVPAPYPGPSQVSMAALSLLIDTGKELTSVNETMTGEVASTAQPTTLLAMIEQGEKVFTAAYKRVFRALRKEFSLLATINAEVLEPQVYAMFVDAEGADPRRDFELGDMDIGPTANPRDVTNMQKMARAQLLLQLAGNGQVAPEPAVRRALEAAGIEDAEELLPKPDPQMAAIQQQKTALIEQLQFAMAQAQLVKVRAETEKVASETVENRAEASLDLARAGEEARSGRVDQILAVLKVLTEIEDVGNERRRLDAMAAASRIASAPRPAPQPAGGDASIDLGGVLGDGAGQPGPPAGAGNGGGSGLA